MKNIYTLIFSLNNIEKNENFLVELKEIERKEKLLKKIFSKFKLAPRREIVDNILRFAREA